MGNSRKHIWGIPLRLDTGRGRGARDGATVVVPPHVHLPAALDAYATGFHVPVEKRARGHDLANGRELVALAVASGRTLMVSQNDL